MTTRILECIWVTTGSKSACGEHLKENTLTPFRVPGWDVDEDHPRDDQGNILKDDNGNDRPKRRILNPQYNSWVTNFLKLGFPHDKINRLAAERELAEPEHQVSLASVKGDLEYGNAIIIHPRKTDQDATGSGPVQILDGPQYGTNLEKMEDTVRSIFKGRAREQKINFYPNFLYVPDRTHSLIRNTFRGRTLFEYDPNYNGRKTGMLLIEDGGPKPAGGGVGPGGPFYFDFGPA
jgi:hypothetical protein